MAARDGLDEAEVVSHADVEARELGVAAAEAARDDADLVVGVRGVVMLHQWTT